MATVFVALSVASNVVGYVIEPTLGVFASQIVGLAALLVLPLIQVRAQRAINLAAGDPEGRRNAVLTAANWLWIAFGIFMWAATIAGVIGLYLDPELLES